MMNYECRAPAGSLAYHEFLTGLALVNQQVCPTLSFGVSNTVRK